MKRWWNYSPRQPRRRVVRVLAPAMMAGAACLAVSNLPPIQFQATVARTSGAVVTAWAFGTLSEAQQPSSGDACDLRHVCELAISSNGGSGTGTGATIKNIVAPTPQTDPAPNLPFTLRETIDYRRPVSAELGSGGQGTCYPANGMITITADTSDVLVLDIMGQACQAGQTTDQFVLTGSYISDTTSTGQYANVDGIGNVSINTPSGIGTAVKNVKASFVGQLKYTP